MSGELIATLLKAVIFSVLGIIGGGALFESGKGYVKAGRGTEFSGKLEALPFFFGTVVFGLFIQNAENLLGARLRRSSTRPRPVLVWG